MKLYRYVKFEDFENMLQTYTFTFSNPIKVWKSQEEGMLFNFLDEVESRTPKYKGIVANSIGKGAESRYNLYCMCWCKSFDDSYMWLKYSYEKNAVMFEIESAVVKEMNGRKSPIEFKEIRYINELDGYKEIDRLLKSRSAMFAFPEALTLKYANYRCEKEVRSYLFSENDACERIEVSFDCLASECINNVLVHPLAAEDLVEKVQLLCAKHCVRFGGKSKNLDIIELCN